MDNSSRHLIDFTRNARFDALDGQVLHEVKRRLIDSFGCAIGAFDNPLCNTVRDMAREYSGPRRATLWGTSCTTSAEMAAFSNGVMLRVHDFNDTYFASDGAHPSDIVAAIVAVAEAAHADGHSLVLAVATGYEIFCRFMQSVNVACRNYDQGVYVSAAAVLAIGQLLRLSETELAHALALAITPNLPLRQTRHGQLSQWKGCAGADAARNAVFAAHLASRGVAGPSDIFEGKQGLWSVMGRFDWPAAPEWPAMKMIGSTYLKALPVCYHAQAAAQAALQLHDQLRGRDVECVEIASYDEAVRMIGSDPSRWAPQSRETADHSLPFIVATCLVDGAISASSFADELLSDPEIVQLMQRIRVVASPPFTSMYPQAAPARVVVYTRKGDTLSSEVHFPKGHAADPMSDAAVEAKFRKLVAASETTAACDTVLSTLWNIDRCRDIAATIIPELAQLAHASDRGNKRHKRASIRASVPALA
ncbi:MAG TPA: MmgE/PrpD family protein, partial [Burkholderiales bacterium]|nr:MmgE/PrpD family protein [Burkholderiales bacterium]